NFEIDGQVRYASATSATSQGLRELLTSPYSRGTQPRADRFKCHQRGWGAPGGSAMTKFVPLVIAACTFAAAAAASGPSQPQNPSTTALATSSDPPSLPDQELGRRFMVKPEDLPPPRTGPVVSNRPLTLAYHGQTPRVPEGFKAN